MITANDNNFQSLLPSTGVYVLDFGAPWCFPCTKLTPILEKLEVDFPTVTFIKVDVDDCPTVSAKFTIRSVPTLIFFKDGVKVDALSGLRNYVDLKKVIQNLL